MRCLPLFFLLACTDKGSPSGAADTDAEAGTDSGQPSDDDSGDGNDADSGTGGADSGAADSGGADTSEPVGLTGVPLPELLDLSSYDADLLTVSYVLVSCSDGLMQLEAGIDSFNGGSVTPERAVAVTWDVEQNLAYAAWDLMQDGGTSSPWWIGTANAGDVGYNCDGGSTVVLVIPVTGASLGQPGGSRNGVMGGLSYSHSDAAPHDYDMFLNTAAEVDAVHWRAVDPLGELDISGEMTGDGGLNWSANISWEPGAGDILPRPLIGMWAVQGDSVQGSVAF